MKKMSKKDTTWAVACKQLKKYLQKNKYYTMQDIQEIKKQVRPLYHDNKVNSNLFTYGNKKLPKNVMIFNLPTIATCKEACSGCYALQPEAMFQKIRVFRGKNLLLMLLIQYDNKYYNIVKKYFKNCIENHINTYKSPIFRWHEAGDIFNKKYKNFILDIVKNNKKINFYGYSKQLNYNEITEINNTYKNFNIVASDILLDNELVKNYGNIWHLKNIKDNIKNVKICSYGTKNEKTCMAQCKHCLYCQNVLFLEHGHGLNKFNKNIDVEKI